MLQQTFDVVSTAILSSLLTWAMAYAWFRYRIAAGLEAQIRRIEEDFEARVKAGAIAAGEELLPKFRKAVAEGFTAAIAASPANLAETATRTVVKGAGLFGEGISGLMSLIPGSRK